MVDGRDEESPTRFWVTFPEYGNSAVVDLGEMELLDAAGERGSASASASRRSRSRSRDRGGADTEDLMRKVLQTERDASAAVGKNYGHRPASYKGSLSLKLDRHTVRRRSRSRSPPRERERDRERARRERSRSRSPPKSAAPAVSREYLERMQKLKEKYGDASKDS